MKIRKLEFKNLKSYGEQLQVIEFSEQDNLILLSGRNGSGKSTIKDAIDFCLYNKVSGRRKKNLPISKFKNRINYQGIPYAGLEFINNENNLINLKRYYPSTKNELFINNVDFSEKFKKYSDNKKDSLIGFNYETFKSFISLSMNDFKNFITLKNTEKNELVNKLFNLEMLDFFSNIIKDELKEIENSIEFTYSNYNNNEKLKENTYNLIKSIEKSENLSEEDIKKQIKSKEPEYKKLNNLIKNYEDQIKNLNIKITKYKSQKNKKEKILNKKLTEIENIEEKIQLYNHGYCPYCDTKLKGNSYLNKKKELIENKENIRKKSKELENLLEKMNLELSKIINKKNQYYNFYIETKTKKEELIKTLKILKNKKNKIKEESSQLVNLNEIQENFNNIKSKSYDYSKKLKELKEKKKEYETLKNILDENNIRKGIIKQAVKPINKYINEYSKKLNLNFSIELSNNFDAYINNNIVDSETLSLGEDKIINIVIALSYLCTILDKQYSNILFIDELFNSIDKENINLILNLLKEISKQYKINIIIVHHYLDTMNIDLFDKIIKVEKTKFGFSELKIIKNNE